MELVRHKNQKATAQWAIDLLASQRTKRYLKVTERGDVRLDTNAIKGTDGKWVIETNDDTLIPEDVASAYKGA